jgi:hypothetical protein
MNTRLFLYGNCFIVFATAQSQETTESAIIISEANLISIIKKSEKRDAILFENEEKISNNISLT